MSDIATSCTIDGCERPVKIQSLCLCEAHYFRLRKHGDPLGGRPSYAPRGKFEICTMDGCGKPHFGHGLCSAHYTRKRRGQDLHTLTNKQRVSNLSHQEIVRLYVEEQQSTIQIARQFDIADVTVLDILKRNDVATRSDYLSRPRLASRRARAKLDEDFIVATYRAVNDIGVYELARLHNANATTIKNILVERGVTIRDITKVRHAGKWKPGVDHPAFDPTLSAEDREKIRPTNDVAKWRLAVFKRDRFECQSCQHFDRAAAGARLEAHHIENWSSNRDKRYVVENGVTLCKTCHVSFHKIYGVRNNNRTQLAEFLAPAMEIAA